MTQLVATACFVLLATVVPGCTSDAESRESNTVTLHKSPQDVFHAFRGAWNSEDWQGVLRCLSSRAQDELVYEHFVHCGLHLSASNDAVTKLLKKHRVAPNDLDAEYRRRLAGADFRNGEELLREIVLDRIDDRGGFITNVRRLFAHSLQESSYGVLQDVQIRDGVAVGYINGGYTIQPIENGRETVVPDDSRSTTFARRVAIRFCKVNGGWLIDDMQGT